jgi:hypothetical protein
MGSYSVIVQGDGKGHFSQSLVVTGMLADQPGAVRRVYLGKSLFKPAPAYFHSSFDVPVVTFFSPDFIRTSDKKGILIFWSIIANLLLAPLYLFETCRIGVMMRMDRSDHVVNLYDVLGALAGRWWKRGARRTVLSHHFYLSHPAFIHPYGWDRSWFWLQLLNRFMLRSAHQAAALSFRKAGQAGKITVVPPLIDARIRRGTRVVGERDLCYFMHAGFVDEILEYYRRHPERSADIFTDPELAADVPSNVEIHRPSRGAFIQKMLECRRIVTTAGFDTVAEAFYHGIPVFVIPSKNHYEQYCNALDAARTGMAFHLDALSDLDEADFEPKRNKSFRDWVDSEGYRTILLS